MGNGFAHDMTLLKADTLIIGQGLAGSLLAWELNRRGCQAVVVDAEHEGSASLVAAGLITPITGKRIVLQENISPLLEAADLLYSELSEHFRQTFLHRIPTLRLFADSKQQATIIQRRSDPCYAGFLGPPATAGDLEGLHAPYGATWLNHTGYLDTGSLLGSLKNWLRQNNRLISTRFDHGELVTTTNELRWRGRRFERVVFCEGYPAADNPHFPELPWAGAKGEILELRLSTPLPLPHAILNWGNWLMPRSNGTYRLGATYGWSPLNQVPTTDAQSTLLASIRERIPDIEYELLHHAAGIRPATRTRQPLLGCRSSEPRLHLFNGFGAKGGLLIPWYAGRMADFLTNGAPLPLNADLSRHE